jgi:hypothetical protein
VVAVAAPPAVVAELDAAAQGGAVLLRSSSFNESLILGNWGRKSVPNFFGLK